MKELILENLHYISHFKDFGILVVCVLMGQIANNRFNSSDEEDVKGVDLLVAVIMLSILIHFGLAKLKIPEVRYFIGGIFGLSGKRLLQKLIKNQVWNKYDFISKGKGSDQLNGEED